MLGNVVLEKESLRGVAVERREQLVLGEEQFLQGVFKGQDLFVFGLGLLLQDSAVELHLADAVIHALDDL